MFIPNAWDDEQAGLHIEPPDDAAEGASSGYRLIDRGEEIVIGDEFIDDDAETWIAVGANRSVGANWMVGMRFDPSIFKALRRKR